MKSKDQTLLEQAYQQVRNEQSKSVPKNSDTKPGTQTPKQDPKPNQ